MRYLNICCDFLSLKHLGEKAALESHLVDPEFPNDDVVHCGGHFLPRVVIVALVKNGMNGPCWDAERPRRWFMNTPERRRRFASCGQALLPNGMMERYLPRNLLATVISCRRVQPRSEMA